MQLISTLLFFPLMIKFSIENTLLRRIDNSCCPGDTIKYECQSLRSFSWQFRIGNEHKTITFAYPVLFVKKSTLIRHSVNFTVVITNTSNASSTSILSFIADPILRGVTEITCDGSSQDFHTDGK